MKNIVQYFCKTYITLPYRLIFLLLALEILIGGTLTFINQLDFHYTTVVLFASHVARLTWLGAALIVLFAAFFVLYGLWVEKESVRACAFMVGLGLFFWSVLANLIFANGLQTTPFMPIDLTLVKIDRWMGIHTPLLMAWTYQHALIHRVLNFIYNSLEYELIIIPLLLAIFSSSRTIAIFYLSTLSSLLVGCLIYYFFPTTAPSGVFHSPYFSQWQRDTSLRFYEVHHALKVTTDEGGLIAFPSFHVIWAILLTYPTYPKKWIFYPLASYNFLLIISTVLLGWHYLTDVIGGVILAAAAIAWGECINANLKDRKTTADDQLQIVRLATKQGESEST